MVAVAALVDRPLTSMIWLKDSKIGGIAGLSGKTIATAGIPYQDAYLKTILARANLSTSDVHAVNVGYGLLPAIARGAGPGDARRVPQRRGRGSAPARQEPGGDAGRPAWRPHLRRAVLVAERGRLEEDPEDIRLFLAALARGTAAAVAAPNETTKALLEANSGLDPTLTKAEVKATLPLLAAPSEKPSQAAHEQPYGFMDPADWRRFIGWMRDNGLILSLPSASEVLSNAYLPGEVPQ